MTFHDRLLIYFT